MIQLLFILEVRRPCRHFPIETIKGSIKSNEV